MNNNKVGRPRIYSNVNELNAKCDEYFDSLKDESENSKPPTVAGLTLFLGFGHKSSLYDYRDNTEFSYPIKRALLKIEKYHEEGLSSKSPTGHIFALKNRGWSDTQNVDLKVNQEIDMSHFSPKQLAEYLKHSHAE